VPIILDEEVVDTSIDDGICFLSVNRRTNHFNFVGNATGSAFVGARVDVWTIALDPCTYTPSHSSGSEKTSGNEATRRRQKNG
jgi:hypothetical protein